MTNEAFPPATAAKELEFTIGYEKEVVVSVYGLTGAETVPIEKLYGSIWGPIYDPETQADFELTATDNCRPLQGYGRYRFNKGVTSAATGLYIDRASTWVGKQS